MLATFFEERDEGLRIKIELAQSGSKLFRREVLLHLQCLLLSVFYILQKLK